jgi:hypothetical protein
MMPPSERSARTGPISVHERQECIPRMHASLCSCHRCKIVIKRIRRSWSGSPVMSNQLMCEDIARSGYQDGVRHVSD